MEMLVIAVIAVVAFAAVLLPLFRRGTRSAADAREFDLGGAGHDVTVDETVPPIGAGPATPVAPTAQPPEQPHPEADAIERAVLRYREALRAGTVCMKCGEANPPDSAFCADCGKRLPRADAREFD